MLGQAGVDYVLAEADTVCSGITKNTTAKITSQHGLIYHKLIRQFGTEKAALYLHSNQEALEKYVQLCEGIDCDFEKKTPMCIPVIQNRSFSTNWMHCKN